MLAHVHSLCHKSVIWRYSRICSLRRLKQKSLIIVRINMLINYNINRPVIRKWTFLSNSKLFLLEFYPWLSIFHLNHFKSFFFSDPSISYLLTPSHYFFHLPPFSPPLLSLLFSLSRLSLYLRVTTLKAVICNKIQSNQKFVMNYMYHNNCN